MAKKTLELAQIQHVHRMAIRELGAINSQEKSQVLVFLSTSVCLHGLRAGPYQTASWRQPYVKLFTEALALETQKEVAGNIWFIYENVCAVRKSQTVQMEKD